MRLRFELRGVRYFRENKLWFIALIYFLLLLPPLPAVYIGPSYTISITLLVWYAAVLLLAVLPMVGTEKRAERR